MPQSNQDNEIREIKQGTMFGCDVIIKAPKDDNFITEHTLENYFKKELASQKQEIVKLAEGLKKLYNGDDNEEYIDYCENYNEALSDIIKKLG